MSWRDEQFTAFGLKALGLINEEPPIPTRWQRFMEWLAKVIERLEGRAIQKGAE